MGSRIYLTTTLPYVNADPHIGFALELVQADIVARYQALGGGEVLLNTGTDEHGLKIYRQALAAGLEPQAYVDGYATKFRELLPALGIVDETNLKINFVRTTDAHHITAAQEFWRRCAAAGDIYKKEYQVKYCVGCELEKTGSELVNSRCSVHPNLELELIAEENYFFKFSKYQSALLELYEKNPDLVVPASRLNEIRSFVARGLEDFSISRLASKMPWGVPVPEEEASLPASRQVMYVWFDALVNYISAIGWPDDEVKFKHWWSPARTDGSRGGVTQFAGKDNLRQQAAMWQAMLMSAGLPPSKQIIIHGFIQNGGQKMSKSLGNVINPLDLVNEYGTDAVRYFLTRHAHPFEDSDVTLEKFKEAYNANLANGLGNLVSRLMKLASANNVRIEMDDTNETPAEFGQYLEKFEIQKAIDLVWSKIAELDREIQAKKPWESKDKEVIKNLVFSLYQISRFLEPFMPATSQKIKELIETNQMPEQPLFARK